MLENIPVNEGLTLVSTIGGFIGVKGFLTNVCKPAAEEIGLMLKDHTRIWRLNNLQKMLEKSESKFELKGNELQLKCNPKVGLSIIENASMVDDGYLQDLWAGLFVSSCTENGQEDENLIFVDLLKKMTKAEAKILKYCCENSSKYKDDINLVHSNVLIVNVEEIIRVTEINTLHKIDRILDHLRNLGFFGMGGGLSPSVLNTVDITPTDFALNLYIKCQGFNKEPIDYWKDKITTKQGRAK